MDSVILDGREIYGREALHDCLAPFLPEYYGRNLDALLDCLTDRTEPMELVLRRFGALEAHLGGYARSLRAVLRRAAEENPRISLREEPPPEP